MVKRYEASRVGTGQVKAATYDREERLRIERTIELINTKDAGRQMMAPVLCGTTPANTWQTSSLVASDVSVRFSMFHASCASR